MSYRDLAERMIGDAIMNRKDAVLLVEDFDDQVFWEDIINHVAPNKTFYFPNTKLKGADGKDSITKYIPYVQSRLIVCYDSDNKYLIGKDKNIRKPFVYQTYVYSIEGFSFYPKGLRRIVKDITLIDKDVFENFLHQYSLIVADLFFLWVYFYESDMEEGKRFFYDDILKYILSINADELKEITDLEFLLNTLKEKVSTHINAIKEEIGDWVITVLGETKSRLSSEWDIEEHHYYLFFRGHTVKAKVIRPLVEKIINICIEEKTASIKGEYDQKVLDNKLAQYQNFSSKDLNTKLKENYRYSLLQGDNPFLEKILADIRRDFN